MQSRNLVAAGCALAILVSVSPASATLYLEPIINRAKGNGPGPLSFPLYDTEFLNGATGLPFATADEPGEIVTYPAGVPAGEDLFEFSVWNNTNYAITSLIFKIVGYADEPVPYTFYIFRDPDVDAFFGDANGDGLVGESDIFPIATITDGGKTLTLSGGVIPLRGRFTDAIHSYTTDGLPFLAAIDASFDGFFDVPTPAGWTAMLFGLGALGAAMRRRPARLTGSGARPARRPPPAAGPGGILAGPAIVDI